MSIENSPDINKVVANLLNISIKELTEPLKKRILEWWSKLEYGVTLDVEETNGLKKIAENSELYKLFKKYLGGHRLIGLIKVGIYISALNEEGKKEKVKVLTDEAYRTYGEKGARVIQLASTGILEPVMEYIIDLKLRKGANIVELNDKFDKILTEWQQIAVPISTTSAEEDIQKRIQLIMEIRHPIFFVYASGNASLKAQMLLARLNNESSFRGKYLMYHKIKTVQNPRYGTVEYCLWNFEIVDKPYESTLSEHFK